MITDALALAANGYRVFPCVGKTPLTPRGCLDASTDAIVITAWWLRWPTAAIGVATGAESGLWVLDSDMKDGKNGEQTIGQLTAQHGQLPDSPTSCTPSGGFHRWFAWPAGIDVRNSVCRIGDGLDVRGTGGYVIAPPSLGYAWSEFDDIAPPPAPSWLVDLVTRQEKRTDAPLAADIIPNGKRNDTLARLAGTMRRTGMSRDAIEAALVVINRERCSPPLSSLEIGRVAASIARYEPNQVSVALAEGWADDLVPVADDASPGEFPDALLEVPGIVGAWCDFIDRTSFKRQPVLALGAVLSACGGLIGRRLETDYGGRANLYCLGVCSSGGGKERARQGVKEILHAAGADRLIGPEDLASEAGLVNALVASPALLFQLDEVGKLLRSITGQGASSCLAGIISALLKLYSSANSIYKGKAYADAERNPVIQQPHACLYGTTVPESLWEALGSEAISDGLLARCLVFVTADNNPPRQAPEPRTPPPTLVAVLREWAKGEPIGLASIAPVPTVVPKTAEAEAVMLALDDLVRAEQALLRGDALATLWTRLEQKADQLALVYAWSKNPATPVIDEQGAIWGRDVAVYLTKRLIWECRRFIAENKIEAEHKKLLRIVEASRGEGLTLTDLSRKTQWLARRQREELLTTLVEAGQVVMRSFGTRRPGKRVFASQHAPTEADTPALAIVGE